MTKPGRGHTDWYRFDRRQTYNKARILAKVFTLAKSRQDLHELNRFLVHFALSNNHSVVTMVIAQQKTCQNHYTFM